MDDTTRGSGAAAAPPGAAGASNVRRVTSAVFWNFFGKTFLLAVRFAESVILVRLLGGESYGLYGSLINLEAIAVLVISLGLENAISRFAPQLAAEGDTGKLKSLLRKTILFRTALLVPAGVVLIAGGGLISSTFFHGLLPVSFLKAVFVLVVIVGFHSIFRTFLDSFFHVKYISLVDALTQGAYIAAAAVAVSMGYGLRGVFSVLILAQGAAAIALFMKFGFTLEAMPDRGGASGLTGSRVIGYSWSLYLFSILLYVLGKGMDVLLIGTMTGDLTQVAWYLIAFNLAYYSLSVMDIAVSANFIVSLIVEAHTAGNEPLLRKIFTGLFEFIYVYCLPVAAGGLLLAPAVVGFVYGPENLGAATLMVVFIAAMTVGKLSSITSYFLVVLDREKTLVRARFFFGLVNLAGALLLIPRWGALGAVIATSVVMLFITGFEAWLVGRVLRPRYSASFLLRCLAAAAIMAAAVGIPGYLWEGPLALKVPVLVVCGGLIYLWGIRKFRPFSPEVVDLLSKTEYPFRAAFLKLMAIPPSSS